MNDTKYYYKKISLNLILLLLLTTQIYAKDIINKPIRDIEVTLSYTLDIEGRRTTTLNLTSLLPQTMDKKQVISNIVFSPEPNNIFTQNGNEYAQWTLKGKTIKSIIEIRFNAKLHQQILENIKSKTKLHKKNRLKFLRREKYVEVGSKTLKNAERKIKHSDNNVKQVEFILKFVKKNMKPTNATREMLGASKALIAGKGDCTEYTDIFIALCRQFKLPAKHMSGYIITQNGCVGHSWAEVYTEEKGWLIVDPLHMDQKLGKFKKLNNKYLAFSSIRNDSELGKGMLYSWNIKQAKTAKVTPKLTAIDK